MFSWLQKSPKITNTLSPELIQTVLEQYALSWRGTHGVSHWARVFENGYELAQITQAKLHVVQLFALFHDAKRVNEGRDKGHGQRGAEYAATLRGQLFELDDEDFQLLYQACAQHTNGLVKADITVQTCWDADRLDLGRVNIRPREHYLCTDAAKAPSMISWATERARKRVLPQFVYKAWQVKL
ncbi:MAG: hypothetical protein SVR94_11470 [Pseudomonadota bacterium]|nr:hypothetical protein [Pseudomonadota bacterium]